MSTTSMPTVAPARRAAYTVLRRVFERGAYADRALHAATRDLDARDRALAMRLAFGAVQRRATLDHVLAHLCDRPLGRLAPPLLAALRLGVHELLYMRGAPDHAIVDDCVELAKRDSRAGHGLVNAVLRRAAREGQALLAQLSDDTPEAAAIAHSHPEWIARLWWQQLGAEDARALMAADNEPGEVAVRANPLVAGGTAAELARALPVRTHADPLIPEALVLEEPLDMHASPLWREGRFAAQSRAAMLVSRALGPQPQERVLDLCAAPGGKTTHLAALMQGRGEVVAVERNAARAEELRATAQRMHAPNVAVEVADAARPRADSASFDRVLVDPPCSGLGTLQARPDLRWRVNPASLPEMAAAQRLILGAGARALRPGGVLVYSTCTISADENERLIEAFLHSHPDFACDDLAAELPGFALSPAGGAGGATGIAGVTARASAGEVRSPFVQTLPHRDRTAGFFVARLRRS